MAVVELLAKKGRADVNLRDNKGHTALAYAAYDNNPAVVKWLRKNQQLVQLEVDYELEKTKINNSQDMRMTEIENVVRIQKLTCTQETSERLALLDRMKALESSSIKNGREGGVKMGIRGRM